MKNTIVGACALIPLLVVANSRERATPPHLRRLALLTLGAIIGGSLAYTLSHCGLQISASVTAALVDHTQFLYIALFTALRQHRRIGPAIRVALATIFIGSSFGVKANVVR